jgi:hypothetical protein
MMRKQTFWQHNEKSRKEFLFEILQFDYTSLYIFISWSSELNHSTLRFKDENCSRWKSKWWFWKRFCRRSLLKRRIRYSRINIDLFRTLFKLTKKRLNVIIYIWKKQKSRIRTSNTFTFAWKRDWISKMSRCYHSAWKINC